MTNLLPGERITSIARIVVFYIHFFSLTIFVLLEFVGILKQNYLGHRPEDLNYLFNL